jgi:PAS domain S-box-containing protein
MNASKGFYFSFFGILIILVAIAGITFYEFRQKQIKHEKYTELSAIADLKVSQIFTWREDKVGDSKVIANNPFLISSVDFYFRTRKISDKRDIITWTSEYIKHKGYSEICFLDKKLNIRIGDTSFILPDKAFLSETIENKNPVVSDLYLLKDGRTAMDLYVPLYHKEFATTVGIVILRIDPDQYLFDIVKSWPTPNKTSELLIIRKEGEDSLIYLNRLKHSDDPPFSKKFSVNDKYLPAAMGINGERGIVEGIDYRGVEVLADLREVPNTEWIVVTKTDMDEIYSPLKDLSFVIILLSFLIAGATAALLGLLWRSQKATFYKQLYDSELHKQALLKNFEFLTKYANDIILLSDRAGNITYANEKATAVYGYTVDELYKLNINHLDESNSMEELEKIFMMAEASDGLLYEAIHLTKNGTRFPVESSSRFIDVEGVRYFQSIIRDITEKKKAEEEIIKALKEKEILLKEVHHRVKNNLQTISSLLNLQAAAIDDTNVKKFFIDSQNRIRSMALIHQELYALDLANINAAKYIKELISHLSNSFAIEESRINIIHEIEDKLIGIDLAVPIGLIITEIITNIFKHAFPGNRKGTLLIEFKEISDGKILRIKDDGVGLPAEFDIGNSTTLGMQLITTLTDQINGTLEVNDSEGTEFVIRYQEIHEDLYTKLAEAKSDESKFVEDRPVEDVS